jgi:hypothetical protein
MSVKPDYSPWHPVLLPFIGWGWLIFFVTTIYDAAQPARIPSGTGPSNSDALFYIGPVAIVILGALLQLICGLPLLWIFRRVRSLLLRLLFAVLPPLAPCVFIGKHSRNDIVLAAVLFVPPFICGTLYIHWTQARTKRRSSCC